MKSKTTPEQRLLAAAAFYCGAPVTEHFGRGLLHAIEIIRDDGEYHIAPAWLKLASHEAKTNKRFAEELKARNIKV